MKAICSRCTIPSYHVYSLCFTLRCERRVRDLADFQNRTGKKKELAVELARATTASLHCHKEHPYGFCNYNSNATPEQSLLRVTRRPWTISVLRGGLRAPFFCLVGHYIIVMGTSTGNPHNTSDSYR